MRALWVFLIILNILFALLNLCFFVTTGGAINIAVAVFNGWVAYYVYINEPVYY